MSHTAAVVLSSWWEVYEKATTNIRLQRRRPVEHGAGWRAIKQSERRAGARAYYGQCHGRVALLSL